MMTTAQRPAAHSAWFARLRFIVGVLILLAGLHWIVQGLTLPRGLDRPVALVSSPYGPLAGLLLVGVLWIGTALLRLVIGPHRPRVVLMALGLALALWGFERGTDGGTMDSWLILRNENQGPPTGGPYWLLLIDYVYLAAGVAGAWFIASKLGHRSTAVAGTPVACQSSNESSPKATAGSTSAHIAPSRVRCSTTSAASCPFMGALAMLVTVLVAGVVTSIPLWPPTAETRRGQVYFAVALGFAAGAYVSRRLLGVRDPAWYWPAPLILGAIGLLVAAIRPGLCLPATYLGLNSLPAWPLARPLPVEMVGVGTLVALWMLRDHEQPSASDAAP